MAKSNLAEQAYSRLICSVADKMGTLAGTKTVLMENLLEERWRIQARSFVFSRGGTNVR